MTDATPAPAERWAGAVPERVGGAFYSTGLVILLTIVTLGIWPFFWAYRTSEDLKAYNGEGLGGAIAVVLWFFIHPVVMFIMPNEVQRAYERDGRESPRFGPLGSVVPAAVDRAAHLVREGAGRAQRLLGEQGRPPGLTRRTGPRVAGAGGPAP
jgi:hypothetical protein